MGAFKQRKNKRYNYTPRFYKGEGSPFEMKHKFDDFRTTVGANKSVKAKLTSALDELKNSPDEDANRRILIILAVLVVIFLFVIGFDLSIFFSR